MANRQRGEVELVIGERTLTLCLTLGALAEIEALCPPGEALGAGRLLLIVEVLARGGGLAGDPAADAKEAARGLIDLQIPST